jgi:hypothetical protein
MRRFPGKLTRQSRLLSAVSLLSLLIAGCSEAKRASVANAVKPLGIQRTATPIADGKQASARPRSIFTVDDNTRDPFFPKSKRRTLVASVEKAPPMEIPLLLQAEFEGTIGSGDHRIAVISNIMLEPGRQTVIPLHSGGQERRVSVRCREVYRNAVVLEVQGYPEPLTITRTQR